MKGPYCDPNLKFNLVYKNNVSNSTSDNNDNTVASTVILKEVYYP